MIDEGRAVAAPLFQLPSSKMRRPKSKIHLSGARKGFSSICVWMRCYKEYIPQIDEKPFFF